MTAKLMLIHCLSPLHAGTGQGVGAVDLPISRESSTGLPSLPGSSIKGSLRDKARHVFGEDRKALFKLFGPDTANASDHAGAVTFGDAQLLCLPTRSVYGTFAWITSPLLLQRLFRDATEAGLEPPVAIKDILISGHEDIRTAGNSSIITNSRSRVFLEDFDLNATSCQKTEKLAGWLANLFFGDDSGAAEMFKGRIGIVHDDIMVFLSRYAIDVVTRSSIDPDTKTVKPGQLWTEENLPTETLLVSLVADIPVLAKKVPGGAFERLEELSKSAVQFGGHATIGRGRARVMITGGNR